MFGLQMSLLMSIITEEVLRTASRKKETSRSIPSSNRPVKFINLKGEPATWGDPQKLDLNGELRFAVFVKQTSALL